MSRHLKLVLRRWSPSTSKAAWKANWPDELAGSRFGEPNLPFLAIIDLASGDTAPVLPRGASSQFDSDYFVAAAGRISEDGGSVYVAYSPRLRGLADGDGDVDVLKLSVSVGSILEGIYEPELIIEGLGDRLVLELSVNPGPLFVRGSALPMPASGRSLLVPVNQPLSSGRTGNPDQFAVIEANRTW